MWIDWRRKKMKFTHERHKIALSGVRDCTDKCTKIKPRKLTGFMKKGAIAQLVHLTPVTEPQQQQQTDIPPEIHAVIDSHQDLFQYPTALPPSRDYYHQIPLIPGVKPVNVKPYRYSPIQKDEIERQVKEMLANGIIKPSCSPFASPVLLVKKKDGSWRFCIDYR
jgi:hypothetical protein